MREPTYFSRVNHCHPIIHVLDDLEPVLDAGGLGEGFHEGILSLTILKVNPHCPVQPVLARSMITKSLERY
jgi:hypothetical protein